MILLTGLTGICIIIYFLFLILRPRINYRWVLLSIILNFITTGIYIIYAFNISQHWYYSFACYITFFIFFLWILAFLSEKVFKLTFSGLILSLYILLFNIIIFFVPSSVNMIFNYYSSTSVIFLAVHSLSGIMALSGFFLASSLSLIYIVSAYALKYKIFSLLSFNIPPLKHLDSLNYKLTQFSFMFFTFSLVSGFFWYYKMAHTIFIFNGKIIWVVITYLYYLLYFHLRLKQHWKGKKSAYLSLAGILIVLITIIVMSVSIYGGT